MKYKIYQSSVKQKDREEFNRKLLKLIDNKETEKYGINGDDVYNAYTGDGGLHGLNRKDYDSYGNTGKFEKTPYSTVRELAKCSLFTASILKLDGKTEIHCEDSFTSLLVLEGKVTVKWKDGEIKASKGASIFVPADCLTELSGETEILISKV